MPVRLEITPSVIDKRVHRGETHQETLTLTNRGGEDAAYELEEEAGWVTGIAPDSLAVDAGKSASVALTLTVPADARVLSTHTTKVVAINPDDSEDAGEVQISLRVQIPWLWILLAIVAIALILVIIWQIAGAS